MPDQPHLFVGGPLDGSVKEVEGAPPYFMCDTYTNGQLGIERYRLVPLLLGVVIRHVYVAEAVPLDEAADLLIGRYRRSGKGPRHWAACLAEAEDVG